MPAENGFWSAKANLDFIGDIWSMKGATLCFNTLSNQFIQLPTSIDYCDAVKKIICKGQIGVDCTKDKADFSKAPIMKLSIGDKAYSFDHNDYLFVNQKNVVECYFGETEEIRGADNCPKETTIGIGKQFYDRFWPILKYQSGKPSTFILVEAKDKLPPNKKSNLIWLIIGGGIAAVALVVIVILCVKKKSKEEDEVYNKVANDEHLG